jgi:ADP-L-glycero-D-manno-heptose 6-epimerase
VGIEMIVVTGAAGFIGSNIVAELNESGDDDVAAVDWLGDQDKWLNLRKRVLRDVVPPEELFAWLEGRKSVRAVLHMGANSSTMARDGDDIMKGNFRYSLRLLDWCAKTSTPFVYASSAATYGEGEQGFDDDGSLEALRKLRPLNLYGWSKHLFDLEIANRRARGERLPPACVGLKFFNVYGPNEHHKGAMMSVVNKSFDPASRGEMIRLFKSYREGIGDGEQRRDFVYVRDVVNVVLWFARRGQDVGLFNVGSGKARAFRDLIGSMFDAMGRPRKIEYVEMPIELRERYQYFTEADLSRLHAVGYNAPMTDLEDGVGDFVRNYLDTPDRYR